MSSVTFNITFKLALNTTSNVKFKMKFDMKLNMTLHMTSNMTSDASTQVIPPCSPASADGPNARAQLAHAQPKARPKPSPPNLPNRHCHYPTFHPRLDNNVFRHSVGPSISLPGVVAKW